MTTKEHQSFISLHFWFSAQNYFLQINVYNIPPCQSRQLNRASPPSSQMKVVSCVMYDALVMTYFVLCVCNSFESSWCKCYLQTSLCHSWWIVCVYGYWVKESCGLNENCTTIDSLKVQWFKDPFAAIMSFSIPNWILQHQCTFIS